ncbi:MAG: undecaprenyl-diphosphate phosphatase [Mycobacteriales bacterium]
MAEVVPVSSSAQLSVLPWLLGWPEAADRTTFAAALHAGSCAGIAWTVRAELTALTGTELVVLGAASVPAAVAGLVVGGFVEARLGGRLTVAGLLAGAGVLLWAADLRPGSHGPRPRDVAAAALAQVAALAPGVSRSGSVLTALRALKVDAGSAQRLSLLMSLPVTGGAAALTLLRADRTGLRTMTPALIAGLPMAALVAALSTERVRRRGAVPVRAAALYRLALAGLIVVRHRRDSP